MIKHTFIKTVILLIALSGCRAAFPDNSSITGYNLSSPDITLVLPEILHEVSGLTYIDPTTIACIQDENGILFIYDSEKNQIRSQYNFSGDGDYEDITRVDSAIYILRSDGVLFEISDYKAENLRVTSYATGIPADDNEGLCYDRNGSRLLIGCKSKSGKGEKDKRAVYGFDLRTKTLSKKPVFNFDLKIIKQFAIDQKINLPSKKKKNSAEPVIKFRTSAIGIHPLTNKLYLLSASDHMLFIFDMNGNIEHMEQLDPEIFNKAEGITFSGKGDMLITNEGQNKKPTLLRFNYRKK